VVNRCRVMAILDRKALNLFRRCRFRQRRCCTHVVARHEVSIELCLGKEEDATDGSECKKGSVEPPKAPPSQILGHRSRDDRTNLVESQTVLQNSRKTSACHQRSEVERKIKCLILSSIVEENNVCNDCWLRSFSRASP